MPMFSTDSMKITLPNSTPSEELYRFGADGNLRLYSYDRLFYSLYGYNGGTTRTYKYSFDLNPNWVNGRLESVNFNPRTAMFYPNSYLNFNQDGHYTKHYYNGMERIASRLGDQNLQIDTHDPELQDRKEWQDSLIRKNIVEITGYEFLPVGEEQTLEDPKPVFELPQVGITSLQPISSGSVYYYHPNHLGSTCYVTDENRSVVQGFLYAPFGEITNEHNSGWQNGVLPKYSFNAKELDEETGMYYYEARYYAPPVFVSRDPLFEKYPTFSPYAYCANNPVKYVDPDGREIWIAYKEKKGIARLFERNKYIVYTPNMKYLGKNSFVRDAIKSLDYIYNNNADVSGIIEQSINTTEKVIIKKTRGNDHYKSSTKTIYWSTKGMEVYDNSNGDEKKSRQSGALGLFHELGHFFRDVFKHDDYVNSRRISDDNYTNLEEQRVIEDYETPAAKILGEGTRNNHDGKTLNTIDPISTQTKHEQRVKKRAEINQNENL